MIRCIMKKQCTECPNPLPDKRYRNEVGQAICLSCHKAVILFLTELIAEQSNKKGGETNG
jgi:hypothetical protein